MQARLAQKVVMCSFVPCTHRPLQKGPPPQSMLLLQFFQGFSRRDMEAMLQIKYFEIVLSGMFLFLREANPSFVQNCSYFAW